MPVDPKTGKEYPYTDEGIAQHKEDTGGMPMKTSGFKMRSGNATPFKQMGSSPAKAEINPFVESMNKSFQGVKGTTSPNPNFNWAGSSAETEKFGKYQNQPKLSSKTIKKLPPHSTAKGELSKKISTKNIKVDLPTAKDFLKRSTVKPKPHVKPKGVFGPGTRPLHPKVAKDIAKVVKGAKTVGKRFLGPVGVALTAYDIATTIPKVVKATDKSLKSEAKKRGEGKATDLFTGPKY